MKLETARLILKPPAEEDAAAIAAVANDWRVARMTLVPHPYTPADALVWVERARGSWKTHGFGGFAVFTKGDGVFIGATGLRPTDLPDEASTGFWFSPAVWGKGYATEALLEVLRFGFGERGLARIEAFHLAINPASGRVMEKAGMGHPTPVELPDRDDGRPVPGFVRHLRAGEWRALASTSISP
jgi:RimJ/RimL family protein N-acetyltransferase